MWRNFLDECILVEHTLNSQWNIYALLKFLQTGLLIESLIIGHWSESEGPSLFPKVPKYKPLFSSPRVEYSIWSVGNSSAVWLSNCIPEIITWPMKESKFRVWGDLVHETRKETNMNKKIPVKRQPGKRPRGFPYIVSALLPQATPQGLCFLLSLQLLPSWLGYFDYS